MGACPNCWKISEKFFRVCNPKFTSIIFPIIPVMFRQFLYLGDLDGYPNVVYRAFTLTCEVTRPGYSSWKDCKKIIYAISTYHHKEIDRNLLTFTSIYIERYWDEIISVLSPIYLPENVIVAIGKRWNLLFSVTWCKFVHEKDLNAQIQKICNCKNVWPNTVYAINKLNFYL